MFYHHHRSSPVSTSTYTHRLGTSSAPLTDTFGTLFPRFGDVFGTLRFTSVSIFTTTRPPRTCHLQQLWLGHCYIHIQLPERCQYITVPGVFNFHFIICLAVSFCAWCVSF